MRNKRLLASLAALTFALGMAAQTKAVRVESPILFTRITRTLRKDFFNTNYHKLFMNGCAQQLYDKLHGNYMLKEKKR